MKTKNPSEISLSEMAAGLCTKCEISVNFSVNKIPPHFDLKPVSTSDNEILRCILEKNIFEKCVKFVVLVDGARYGIEITKIAKTTVFLKQFVLHYNGDNLVPVYVRFVKIVR